MLAKIPCFTVIAESSHKIIGENQEEFLEIMSKLNNDLKIELMLFDDAA
jgi:hypothetical protein